MRVAAYPLCLRPMLYDKVWGGDRLARFGKQVSPGARVGESWELADLDQTSASGAGGGAARSIIENGVLAGSTLGDAMRVFGRASMLGAPSEAARFPLLVKFLDARENLSVQVHPSIAYAKAHAGANIKTECWYILESEPGSVIYKGVKPGVTREEFERCLRDAGSGAAGVVDLLEAVPAIAGEMHNLPSGTVHALGAGVLVAEVQTPSDTTFRVYDWGRSGRELHVDQALECIMFGPARDATRLPGGATIARLVSTGFFLVDEMRVGNGGSGAAGLVSLGMPASVGEQALGDSHAVVVVVLDGSVGLTARDGSFEAVVAAKGTTVIVPASAVPVCVVGSDRAATILRTVVMG